MDDPGTTLKQRLLPAREEAEALVWYFARHSPGGSDEDASAAYCELVKALSASFENEDENTYENLMVSYHKLARFTFAANEVHGKSILDTTVQNRSRPWRDKRRLPVCLGLVFFGLALVFQALDAWTESVVGAKVAAADSAVDSAVSLKFLFASLLASCIPLLTPVAWGALGACTALAKRVSDRLSAMSYEDNRMQALTSRIFLGAALALVLDILVFVEGTSADGNGENLGFGPIAGAFLAGLFVQHIYGALEMLTRRVAEAISSGRNGSRPLPRNSPIPAPRNPST